MPIFPTKCWKRWVNRLPTQSNRVQSNKVRILGIDPGSLITGFGIIESDGSHNQYIASGPINIKGLIKDQIKDASLPERLKIIFEEVTAVIQTHKPEVVAVEQVFMNRNADSALKLGQARGAAITAAVMQDLPVFEYTPRHIKQSVVGKGGASKQQVLHMVKVLLNTRDELQADESDALAVALCHGHIGGTMERIEQQVKPTARRRVQNRK